MQSCAARKNRQQKKKAVKRIKLVAATKKSEKKEKWANENGYTVRLSHSQCYVYAWYIPTSMIKCLVDSAPSYTYVPYELQSVEVSQK